ncbi:winged helix DNA-binding protein [Novosphingobium sp. PS1R-30]|uniref:Winged helix DNA-binding protein n=1 Tax=Novosphingobium anseongense TaxID=3133436 RepID=A0ABU8RY93_9SPHN
MTIALAWVAARQARNRVLDSSLFADPAWDILLDLYICHAQDVRGTISDACIASSVPATTALRWISILESRDLVTRSRDPKDRRRTFLNLSAQGVRKMEEALDGASASDAKLGLGRLRAVK